jgi:cytochrome P450
MASQTQAPPLAERPDHVPEALVHAFDMFNDPEYLANPHDRILRLHREAPPVFWTPYNGGVWMLLGYDANFTAMRDPALFSSQMFHPEMQKLIDEYLSQRERRVPRPVPISLDPPEHGVYREPLQSYFSPRRMMAMQGKIRALAAELIEAVRPQGRCELMAAVAEPLPITVFLELLGLPVDQKSIYLPLAQAHFDALENEPHKLADYQVEVAELMKATVEDRRVNPRDDLLSALWQMEFGGRPATVDDIEDLCAILFLGGLDTVMNGIGFAAVHLARDPQLQALLRADPSRIPGAVEEMLRRYSFALPLRRATADTVLEGAFMKEGDRMVTFLPGANLDPRKFPEPEKYDLSRETNAHIVFGAGPHRCVGAHLARIELQVFYEEMLGRLPEFRLDPSKELTYHGGHTMRPNAVWLEWEA